MPAPSDRQPSILEIIPGDYPLPPLNLTCWSGFIPETFDIHWTPPDQLPANSKFNVVGVNVYRSFDSEFGPYERLNDLPIGCGFLRDRTQVVVAIQEDVSRSFTERGAATDPGGKYMFRTQHKPIVIISSGGTADITNLNVQVTVNGKHAFVDAIYPSLGQVSLRTIPTFDVANQIQTPAVLPLREDDVVLATYRYQRNQVKTSLGQRIFYRVTTVALDRDRDNLIETPLNQAAQTNNLEIEKLDYMWREAIRRQRWLLDRGGERVKAFIRRAVGPMCGCKSDLYGQPSSDCLVCYGTGVIGGYDGPYDITIAPDDGPKTMSQSNRGRRMEHLYDTWTLPSPLLSQRDFIVKLNGDRYGIGAVRMPSNRGMQLQQFFPISHLDEADIRCKVPVIDTENLVVPQTRYSIPGQGRATPMMTDSNVPAERQIRSETVTGENTNKR